MGKELSNMTLEELWNLFPIFLVEHNEKWNQNYDEVECLLRKILSETPVKRISHIGSTAIRGIWAKDIVDVLIEISEDSDITKVGGKIVQSGFIKMSAEKNRISFNSGYTEDGYAEKVFHIHLRYVGDNDELYFRDYLNEHPEIAKEYEILKLRLWKQFEHNRDAYTDAKTEFIKRCTLEAKKLYARRY